jgi:hypothetical protein
MNLNQTSKELKAAPYCKPLSINKQLRNKSTQVKLESVLGHISTKCGISNSLARRTIQELVDYICISLYTYKDKVIFIPRLGFFSLGTHYNKYTINYRPSSFVLKLFSGEGLSLIDSEEEKVEQELEKVEVNTYELKQTTKELTINEIQGLSEAIKKLMPGSLKLILEDIEGDGESLHTDFREEELETVSEPVAKNTPDKVRSSFVDYLQEEFVYGLPWVHPITKQEFERKEVDFALNIYKDYAPTLYNALRFLWLSQYDRATIARQFNVSSSSIRRSWNRAIDGVLLIMLYPHLNPEICIKLYSSRR